MLAIWTGIGGAETGIAAAEFLVAASDPVFDRVWDIGGHKTAFKISESYRVLLSAGQTQSAGLIAAQFANARALSRIDCALAEACGRPAWADFAAKRQVRLSGRAVKPV